jgi:hypothetical protein
VAFEWMPAEAAAAKVTSWSNAVVLRNLWFLVGASRSAM